MFRKRQNKSRIYTNTLFGKITLIYTVILIIMGLLTCYLSYIKFYNDVTDRLDRVMLDLNHQYKGSVDDFWRFYMPVFENRDSVYKALKTYFTQEDKEQLSPLDKKELLNALKVIMNSDSKMRWIGVYSGKEEINYLLLEGETTLTEMPADFPFLDELEQKGPFMEVYGSKEVRIGDRNLLSFALCGGTAINMNGGKIIMGYAAEDISSAYTREKLQDEFLDEVGFYVVNDFGIIYDSTDAYEMEYRLTDQELFSIQKNSAGKLVYIRKLSDTGQDYSVLCVTPWISMFIKCNYYTPLFVLILLVFWGSGMFLYYWAGNVIVRKIDAIRYGLDRIADNELTYRIPITDKEEDEFEHIAYSINEMAKSLQENIHKVYLSRLKQKEAELAELQAKFDPHFLYNTLEVIRGKVYENGDDETADIIVKLAQMFRSFIDSQCFITIRDEMEFCSYYLSFLKYRYENRVDIVYDVESDILEYGIIRNLLQPILENYFVHGFMQGKRDNQLVIRGKLVDDAYICFQFKDNGAGISPERLERLKVTLNDMGSSKESSYGLKNVRRKIRLFYGMPCDLSIDRNEDGGATVQVIILKLSCQEHEKKMYCEDPMYQELV